MPRTFEFPLDTEFWTPRELNPPQQERTSHNFQVVARLANGAALATPREVMTMVMGRGLVIALTGTVIGTLASLLLARLVEGLLFGVSVRDPMTFATMTAITAGAVVIASYLPARRALETAPVESLRSA